jgi:hypothetical protein
MLERLLDQRNAHPTAPANRQWRNPQCFGTVEVKIVSGFPRFGSSPGPALLCQAKVANDCCEESWQLAARRFLAKGSERACFGRF